MNDIATTVMKTTHPDIDPGLDLVKEIEQLKVARHAVFLAHYYQEPAIQDMADYIGDSLALAQNAAKTDAEVILFAGVHFMAETAKILNPDRTVLIPDLAAGCSLADACPADTFKTFIDAHPEHKVISYINCTARVKALSDVICTSSNAEAMIRSFPEDQPLIFAPDRNLGAYLIKKTGREMLLWDGTCMVHEIFSTQRILEVQEAHPGALILAHPECKEILLRYADHIASTTGLLKFAQQSSADTFIVATETGILHQMRKACPGKTFIPAPVEDATCACSECHYMRRNTPEKVYLALRDLTPQITMDEDIRQAALIPLQRMLNLS